MQDDNDRKKGSVLAEQLERMFRAVAFYHRVRLEELALVEPAAARAPSKEAFLRPHLRALRALVRLALQHEPAEVGRLAEEYPDVGLLLRETGDGGDGPDLVGLAHGHASG